METTPQKTSLVIKITHGQPIEIADFASTMSAFGQLFSEYSNKNGDSHEARKAKLYLERVDHGSIELRLVEVVTLGILPFVENVNLIMEFAGYLKSVFDFFAASKGKAPKLTEAECRNFKRALDVVANDNNGEMKIYAVNDNSSHEYNNCVVFQLGANAAQNRLEKEAERLKDESGGSLVREKVVMTIFQMRGDISQKSGNYAQIDDIARRRVAVRFANEALQTAILGSDTNPTKQAYLVDVEVQTVNGDRIAMYNVVKLHEIIPLSE